VPPLSELTVLCVWSCDKQNTVETNEFKERRALLASVEVSWCLAFTRYCYYQCCMVYGIYKGGREGVLYCSIDVKQYCNSVADAVGRVGPKDVRFVHNSLDVNEYLVKANLVLSLYRVRVVSGSGFGLTRYIHTYVYIHISISIYLHLYIDICRHKHIYMYIHISIQSSPAAQTRAALCGSARQTHTHTHIYIYLYLYIYSILTCSQNSSSTLRQWPSNTHTHISIHLSISLSIYLSIYIYT